MKYLSKENFLLFIFVPLLLGINLLQGHYTGLFHDEAYYWVYSQKLAFGYYDHPPMVGWMIFLGTKVLNQEIGVRLVTIVSFFLAVYFMWYSSEKKNPPLFIFSVLGFPLVVGAGFIASPDSALVFFCSVYFYSLKKFLQNDTFLNSLILAILSALMLYSKYPAAVVLLMTALACWPMMKRRSFYIVTSIILVLYLPHIIWQINHNWITLNFHFSAHGVEYFSYKHVIEYILGQVCMGGILIAPLVIYYSFRELPDSFYNRTLKFNIIGVFLLFLLVSMRSKVEVNWTSTVFVTLCICAGSISFELFKSKALFFLLAVPALLLFIVRIGMLNTFEPTSIFKRANEFSRAREVSKTIKHVCGTNPIVANRYQDASKLWFYTGEFVPALHLRGRQSQFSLMDYTLNPESKYCFVSNFDIPHSLQKDDFYIVNNVNFNFIKSLQVSG